MEIIRNGWSRAGFAALILWCGGPRAFGADEGNLPTFTPPPGTDQDDFIAVLRAYALQIAVLAGLAIATIAFIVVAKNVVAKYSQVADNRATWGEVGMHGIAGVLLLVVVVWLVTLSADVLAPEASS